jgi:hypothetical protein
MLMICFILVRGLLFYKILRVWDDNPKYPTKQNIKLAIITCASIISHYILDYIRSMAAIQPNNQVHLPVEKKTKARAPLRADDNPSYTLPKPKKQDEPPWIDGLIAREYLEPVLSDPSNRQR